MTLRDIQDRAGWNDTSLVSVLMDFIEEQGIAVVANCEDYCTRRMKEEAVEDDFQNLQARLGLLEDLHPEEPW